MQMPRPGHPHVCPQPSATPHIGQWACSALTGGAAAAASLRAVHDRSRRCRHNRSVPYRVLSLPAHACWAPSACIHTCSPARRPAPTSVGGEHVRKRSLHRSVGQQGRNFCPCRHHLDTGVQRTRLRRSASRPPHVCGGVQDPQLNMPPQPSDTGPQFLPRTRLPSSSECSRNVGRSGISTAAGLTGGAISLIAPHVNIPCAPLSIVPQFLPGGHWPSGVQLIAHLPFEQTIEAGQLPPIGPQLTLPPHPFAAARSSSRRRQRPASSGCNRKHWRRRRAAATRLGRRAASASDARRTIRHGVAVLARTRIRLRLRRASAHVCSYRRRRRFVAQCTSLHTHGLPAVLTTLPHLVPLAQVCSRASGRQPQTPVTPPPPQVWPIPAQFVRQSTRWLQLFGVEPHRRPRSDRHRLSLHALHKRRHSHTNRSCRSPTDRRHCRSGRCCRCSDEHRVRKRHHNARRGIADVRAGRLCAVRPIGRASVEKMGPRRRRQCRARTGPRIGQSPRRRRRGRSGRIVRQLPVALQVCGVPALH